MASRRIQGITIEIDGNTSKLNDSLKSVDKQLSATQSQLRDVNKLLKLDPKNTELLSQKQKLLTDAVKGSKERLQELQKAAEQLSQKDSTPEVERQQAALQREIIETTAKLKGFEDELDAIPNKAQLAFDSVGKKLSEVGGKISSTGEAITKGVTAPITAVGAASVAAFSEVDTAMDEVILKTGATGEAAADMQKIVEDIATTIPTEFQTAADAVGEVNTKFGATGDELENLATLFVKFASINKTDVTSSVDIARKAMDAYGLKITDTEHFLDILTRTSQNTGATVDSLASGLVQNAAAFQELGLSVDEAVGLMAELERSGANSETVMNGLRKALKNSAKDGVPLSKTLADLQRKIKYAKDETEGLNAAYEVFGKSGDQIFSAIRNGTLDFEALANASEGAGGAVTNTFDATVDGIDQWKVAMNQAKLLGSDIGGILSEFAGPILTKVRDGLKKALEAWRGLSGEQQDNIVKAAGVVAAVGPVVTIIGKVTEAVGLLSKGIGVLAAHPIAAAFIGAAAIIGGVVVAVKDHTDAVNAEFEAVHGFNEEQRATLDKLSEVTSTYDEISKAREDSLADLDAEYGHLEDLVEEYDSYLDSNGNVLKGYEDRAEFIKTTLADALGLEKGDIDEIISANGQLAGTIDTLIEKRKAEAFLTAYQDEYTAAIKASKGAEDELAAAREIAEQKTAQADATEKELAATREYVVANATTKTAGELQEYNDKIAELEDQLKREREAETEASNAVAEAEEAYKGINATIQNYEGLSASIVSGDASKISDSMQMLRDDFRTTETATVDTLRQQVTDYEREYQAAKNAVESGSQSVTKADLEEKQRWYLKAKNEYDKAVRLANSSGDSIGSNFAEGIAAQKDAVNLAASRIKDSGVEGLSADTFSTGVNFVAGFNQGIDSMAESAAQRARAVASYARKAMENTLEIQSPSRVMMGVGKFFTEGFALGIEEETKRAMQAASTMAEDTALAVDVQNSSNVAAANPYFNTTPMLNEFMSALSRMKIELDDQVAGRFVEDTVIKALQPV